MCSMSIYIVMCPRSPEKLQCLHTVTTKLSPVTPHKNCWVGLYCLLLRLLLALLLLPV